MILLLARAVLSKPLGRGLLGLSAVAVGGMVLILNASGDGSSWLGVGLTLAGIGCCALYSVITRRWLHRARTTAPWSRSSSYGRSRSRSWSSARSR